MEVFKVSLSASRCTSLKETPVSPQESHVCALCGRALPTCSSWQSLLFSLESLWLGLSWPSFSFIAFYFFILADNTMTAVLPLLGIEYGIEIT